MTTTAKRSSKKSAKAKPDKPEQKRMEGEGFPPPLPKEVQQAVGAYLTAKRVAAEKIEDRDQAMQKVIELGHKHNLPRIPIEGENKFIEIGTKDTCKVKTKPKDKEESRNGRENSSVKAEFEKD